MNTYTGPKTMGNILSENLKIPKQHLENLTPEEFKELIPKFDRLIAGVILKGRIGAYYIKSFYLDKNNGKEIMRMNSIRTIREPGYCGANFPMTFKLHLNDRLVLV